MNVFDDIDDKLYAFESLFHTIINQHAPLKQAHMRGGHAGTILNRWMAESNTPPKSPMKGLF